jgi:D-amino peptidase
MKIIISVDMEGISGIVDGSMTNRDKHDYEKGRALMVGDVNAAIEGILKVDSEAEIVVSDAHGGMININPEELHESAVLVRGSPKPLTQISGIDNSFDAAMFVGYHSMKGTLHGILSHTISGRTVESITVNGLEVGETGLNGAIAGHFNVPFVFVSGDKAVTLEAKALNPEVEVAAVKKAISRTAAKCLHPTKSRKLIKENAEKAIRNLSKMNPFKFESPVEVVVRYTNSRMADAVSFMPSAERINGKTVKFVQEDFLKGFNALRASIFIAGAVS